MNKKLVACGCSITKDHFQKTWADFLSEHLGSELVNIGARGAGLDFISKRLMMELQHHDPVNTLVGILLPSSDRFDFFVENSSTMKNAFLEVSSWQNGKEPLLVNLDGGLSQDYGYCLTGGQARGEKKYWYKYYHNSSFAHINYWFNIINIQNFLKLKGFEYFFASAYDLDMSTEQIDNVTKQSVVFDDMKQLIDFDRFIFYKNHKGFLSYAKENAYKFNLHYPESSAHDNFVKEIIVPFLGKKL